MSLDPTPLANALLQLDAGLRQAGHHPPSDLARDGVIHRLIYCHGLATSYIRRALESRLGSSVGRVTHKDMLRAAAKYGLITSTEAWDEYATLQAKSLKAYQGRVATELFTYVPRFLADARALLRQLYAITNLAE